MNTTIYHHDNITIDISKEKGSPIGEIVDRCLDTFNFRLDIFSAISTTQLVRPLLVT